MKYAQLNSDVFTGTVTVDWSQMKDEYTHYKKVKGDQPSTLYEADLTLSHFERIIGGCSSKQITQSVIDKFILDRGKEIKRSTLNKDITNLKAFVNWGRANRYMNGDIKLKLLKEDERPVISLTTTQIMKLLSASGPYPSQCMAYVTHPSTFCCQALRVSRTHGTGWALPHPYPYYDLVRLACRHTSFFASSARQKLLWERHVSPEFRCEPLNDPLWSATPARR
jgi:hypothetical protein